MCLLLITIVRAAVGFAGDDGHLGHGRLAVGVEQLGAGADDAAVLLGGAGHEAGHIHEGDHRDVEGIAEADEARGFLGGVDIQHARQHRRLVGDDPHAVPAQPGEPDHDVRA